MSYFYHSYLCNTATATLPTGDPPGSAKATGCSRVPRARDTVPRTLHFALLTATLSYPYFQPKSAYKSFKGEGNEY